MTGRLFVVATPIGNLEDITLRALRVLKEVDAIACEDTRVTKKLLTHFDIHTPTVAFHSNSGEKGFQRILERLDEGESVALVCDAGSPGISDPGLELVARARKRGIPVQTVPGSSALTAAVSISGLHAQTFTFYGFLPLKKGRESLFREIAESGQASVFYESTHRILKALESLENVLEPGRKIGVFRELTKVYEEAIIGTTADILIELKSDRNRQRGEFVVIVEGKRK